MHAVCLLFHVKVGLVNTNMNCMIITLDLDMLQECIAFFLKNFVMTCSMMLFVSPDVSFCYLRCKEMCQFTFCYFTLQYLRFLSFYILKCCILHTVITFYQLISLHLTHYTDLLRNRFHFWGVSPASPL